VFQIPADNPIKAASQSLDRNSDRSCSPSVNIRALPRCDSVLELTNLPLRSVIQDVADRAEQLRHRTSDQVGKIERNHYIVHRAWVVAGTRIPTKAIWNFSQAGYEPRTIIREYPLLTEHDIRAALAHERNLRRSA
jgi:uncharacterized protein (DUF433 family)